jgi:hypothetical protein
MAGTTTVEQAGAILRFPFSSLEHAVQYLNQIGPVAALVAGILILIMPRLLNYIVAVYLIVIGVTGLLK